MIRNERSVFRAAFGQFVVGLTVGPQVEAMHGPVCLGGRQVDFEWLLLRPQYGVVFDVHFAIVYQKTVHTRTIALRKSSISTSSFHLAARLRIVPQCKIYLFGSREGRKMPPEIFLVFRLGRVFGFSPFTVGEDRRIAFSW